MEVERKHSKGGFFHLFDWNGKSRKKLFSNNAEISGESKSGKPMRNLLNSPSYTMEVDEYNVGSSNGRSADFSSASSVVSDEGYGSRAPGVVARLMGLDSLPTPCVSESSTTCSGSCSLRVSHYESSTPNLWNEYRLTDYSDISNKLDRSSSNPIEPRFHKVQNRPIERFQTEILPPKSAKPIPITHHKLLSPIKSPGFIPTKNAAYIMEAAAKIIEVSPQTTSKHKVSSFGSSSVPLKIRDLKEKIETAHKVSRPQRTDEPSQSTGKSLKGQHKGKNHNKSDNTPTFRISMDSGKGSSDSSRNKGKSVPLAEQARVNVRKKEGSIASSNGSSANQKEGTDAKRKQFAKSRAEARKNVEKGTSASRTNNVLRQNNQKQNCISNRDYSTSKTSSLDQQGRKSRSVDGTIGLNRTINKVTVNSESQSRKTGSSAYDPSKELPMSRRKNLSGKKQPVNEDLLSGETDPRNSSINSTKRSIKCNVTTDGHSNQDGEKMKTSMDVVSFTFTSPIKRSMPDVPSTIQAAEMSCSFDSDPSGDSNPLFPKSSGFSSLGFDIIGGDALSVLLGKQLQDLTYRVESSNCNIILEDTSSSPASSWQNSVLPSGTTTTTSMRHEERLQPDIDKDISYSSADFNCSSIDIPELDWRRMLQISEEIEDRNASNTSSETGIESDHHQHQVTRDFKESSTNWELGYVKTVLKDSELNFIEYALGTTDNIMTPKAFEHRNGTGRRHYEEEEEEEDHDSKLEQKLLLDCVIESLELRCEQVFVGRCKGWVKWGKMMMQNKEWLAEEVTKGILGWRNKGELMVEELVGKDMNRKQGRWLDFEMEAFEHGLEIEKAILTCLVDDLVFDLLLL